MQRILTVAAQTLRAGARACLIRPVEPAAAIEEIQRTLGMAHPTTDPRT
jgi:hypothetical protein